MARTTAMEFQRKLGDFLDQARHGPVEITYCGRRELVLMSADHYDWLVAAARRRRRTAEAPSVVVDAVRRAEMSPVAIWDGEPKCPSVDHDSVHDGT